MLTPRHLVLLAAILACLQLAPAHAAAFCVSTPTELQAALDTAESNGEHDTIRLHIGTYQLTERLEFRSGEDFDLTLQGGYIVGCTMFLPDPRATVIDGQGNIPLAAILGAVDAIHSGNIEVRYISWHRGGGNQEVSIYIGGSDNWHGRLLFENNIASDNAGINFAATAVYLANTRGGALVRNNLFIGNTGWWPVRLVSSSLTNISSFRNNTVTGNSHPDAGGGSLFVDSSGAWLLANNIIRGNGPIDIEIDGANVDLLHNDIGSINGIPASSNGDLNVDPGFVDAANGLYALRADSALIDRGFNSGPAVLGTFDVAGMQRVVHDSVDIGAYELQDSIFDNGFD